MASPIPRTSPVWLPDDCDLLLDQEGGAGVVIKLVWWDTEGSPYKPFATIHGAAVPDAGDSLAINREGEGWVLLDVLSRRWVFGGAERFVILYVTTPEHAQAMRDAERAQAVRALRSSRGQRS